MILFIILGAILGAISVIFVLQNVAVVTVSFFTWHITGSLALVLFATLLSGIVIALLVLLPSVIRDDLQLSAAKREKKALEDELARIRANSTVTTSTTVL